MKNTPNIQVEQKQEQNYIPALAFLLGLPIGMASSFFVHGQAADLAVLNQKIIQLIPSVFADDIIQFQGDGQWNNQDGQMMLGDHSNHSNHSNHYSCDDGDDDDDSSGG